MGREDGGWLEEALLRWGYRVGTMTLRLHRPRCPLNRHWSAHGANASLALTLSGLCQAAAKREIGSGSLRPISIGGNMANINYGGAWALDSERNKKKRDMLQSPPSCGCASDVPHLTQVPSPSCRHRARWKARVTVIIIIIIACRHI